MGNRVNITEARTALAARLAATDIANVVETLPDDIKKLPTAAVGDPEEIEFAASMGRDRVTFPVIVLVSRAETKVARAKLDALVSRGVAGNMIDPLMSNRVADGHTVRVVSASEFGDYTVGNVTYYGATVRIEVFA